jgi:hypothetical protein
MIKEIKCYTLLCDNCGADVCEGTDYSGHEEEHLSVIADEENWIEHEGKWYCYDCYAYDNNDELMVKTAGGKKWLRN